MRICYIFCGSLTAAWSSSDGIGQELTRQGHDVLAIARGRVGSPPVTLQTLNSSDLIIVSGPEHILGPQVQDNGARGLNEYSFTEDEVTLYEWRHEVKTPKVFIYHESNRREDRTFGFENFLSYGDYHFFPAVQDAEQYDQGHFALGRSFWMPIGVDTNVFRPTVCATCAFSPRAQCPNCLGAGFTKNEKTIQVGFIGLRYPKRVAYLRSLEEHWKPGRDPAFHVGHVQITDIDGTPYEETARRLAANYRRIAVFLNLPSYSELLVSKVFEVMACGTLLITPTLAGPSERNCEMFKHAQELVYYKPANVPFLVQTAREFYEREELREKIALAGMIAVREKHSLKQRIHEMLEQCKLEKAVTQ